MTTRKNLGLSLGWILFLPLLLQAGQFQVKAIKNAGDLPEKFCSAWKEGDYLVSDGENLVLIGGTERVLKSYYQYPIEHTLGSILSFVPGGKNLTSDLMIGAPYIRVKNRSRYLAYTSLEQTSSDSPEGSISFQAAAVYRGKKEEKAEITTLYRLYPQAGRIDISSTITNTGTAKLGDLHYSLYSSAGQIYCFSPFEEDDLDAPSASPEKRPRIPFWVYPKTGHYLGWIDLNPVEELYQPIARESISTNLDPGKSVEVKYVLLVDTEPALLLQKIYRVLGIESGKARISFSDSKRNLMELVIQDASSTVFFRTFLEEPVPLEVALPAGTYRARANFFPAVVEKTMVIEREKESECLLEDLPGGKVRVNIKDSQGSFVPGKITFIGLDPTRTPYFAPENPLRTRNAQESFKNSCYPQQDGLEIELPVGTYLVTASRGPEYTLDQKAIEVTKDCPHDLLFQIDRMLETKNLISVDPHLHTLNSDGTVTISERLKSVVAEGVDVAISTDHNYLSDYPSVLKKLGLDGFMAALVGQEVSSLDVDENYLPEFNRYPLVLRADEPGNGAIDIGFSEGDRPLFEKSRQKDPGSLIQVNHPHNDYFEYYELDRESAAAALEGFDTSFDLLEVMNGPSSSSGNSAVIQDWLHLLNRGYYFAIVGSSDSHETDRDEPGYARTYVFYEGKKGRDLDERALISALKRGRSFVSNGPLVEFKINDRYIPGDSLTEKGGQVDVGIRVQSAPWISVDELRVIVNGERTLVIPLKARTESTVKYEETMRLSLQKDSYIVLEVIGKDSLYPVLQRNSEYAGGRSAPRPYALTNPVFIDVDGNGKFDAPWSAKIKFISPVQK